jgi:hypothetical protein
LVERLRTGERQQGNCGREHDWAVVDVHNGTSPIPPTQHRAKRSHTADKRVFSGASTPLFQPIPTTPRKMVKKTDGLSAKPARGQGGNHENQTHQS